MYFPGGFDPLAMFGGWIGLVVMLVISLVLGALFLKLGLKAVKAEENTGFGQVFLTNILNIIVSYCCCIIAWFIIKARHKTSLGAAIGAWFIAAVIPMVISFGILLLIAPLLGISMGLI